MRIKFLSSILLVALVAGCGNGPSQRERIKQAEAQVTRLADDLDRRTTDAGTYVRLPQDEQRERDPWGNRLRVDYSAGGVAEMVSVRSAGPDQAFHTEDDITVERMAANFKGVGQGIKDNAEETAANVAKGLTKGAVQGVKESLPSRKKPAREESPTDQDATTPAQGVDPARD